MGYTKTTWIDGVTPLSAANMNNIENGFKTVRNGSYLAFCANVNTNSLDAAFGKNNTDRVLAIGRQLAMYAWFKGTNKATVPFTNLIACDSFQDCLDDTSALDEMLGNSYIMDLIDLSPFAEGLMDAKIITGEVLSTICKNDAMSDATCSYLQSRRSAIITVMDSSPEYFTKTTGATYNCGKEPVTSSFELETNTIIIPTNCGKLNNSGTKEVTRRIYSGSNQQKVWEGSAAVGLAIEISSGVALRGFYFDRSWGVTTELDVIITADKYVAI